MSDLKFSLVSLVLVVTLATSAFVNGQAIQSTILGTVTDPSGAVVTGATVTVKNEGTNIERTIVADANGDYRVAGLETGSYQVSVSTAGFKKFVQTKVLLNASQIKRVDTKLELGEVSDTVTVDGGVGHLETETASLSNIKTTQDYKELPLSIFGRGWANVTNVVAGVQSNSGFEVNGARDTANNFTTDGISVNDINGSRNTANGFSGEVEALAEIKVMTANNSAEYAQVAQFSAVSRAGTNDLHGALYWGNFNSIFSARTWNVPRDPSFVNHNMFSLTNGGPIYIPKVYDGRNRTFYFFSYGGARYRVGARQFGSVPTPAFRQGDFSALLPTLTIVDPLTGVPFAGNRIPGDRINPVSKTVQDLIFPDPNLAGLGGFGLTQNFTGDPGHQFDSDVYSIRGDHKFSDNNTMFARVGLTINNKDVDRGILKNNYGPANRIGNHPGRSIVISDTHTFNPNLVNEFKLGFSRDAVFINDFNFGQDVQIGLQGANTAGGDPAALGLPDFSFGGAVPFIGVSSWPNRIASRQNTYQLIDHLSWYRGRHSFKMGGDIRRYQQNDENKPPELRGSFSFDDRLSGFAYANFLLGYPSSAVQAIVRPSAYLRSWHSGIYFQDDFKINQRITLNYGIRYENQSPWVDRFDRLYGFDPKTGNLVTAGTARPTDLAPSAATLPIITASQAGVPTRSLFKKDNNNWNPRLGMAIRPFADATTVVRAGYGVYTQLWPSLLALNATGGPWATNQSFFLENPNAPTIRFPNPFQATSSFSGLTSIAGLSPDFASERTHQWNLSVGREIWGTAVDIGYVGTKALNIPFSQNLNLLQPSTTPYSSARQNYPRFNSATLIQAGGSSIYHGLTVQADRRVARGLTFNANYTWAKALTDVDLRTYSAGAQQNQYQRSLERGDDANIRRQQLRFSYIYELPFGKSKPFLSGLGGFANKLVEGWQVAGITTMVTGARLSPGFSGVDPANTNQFGGRPDRVGDGNFDSGEMRDRIKSRQPIFDINAFVRPAAGRGFYGSSARNILTGPGQMVWNMAMSKNFYVRERARFQFRWEMFNAFNRPNFNNPGTNISNPGSFGLVTSAGAMRSMLVGLRLDY